MKTLGIDLGGKFSGSVFADKYCLPPGNSPSCVASWSDIAAVGGLWSLEDGTGPNIFKGTATDTAGIVAIGTATPSVALPNADGSRLYIDPSNGNPEIDLGLSAGTANDHWGIYADTAGGSKQLRFWQGDNRFAYTNEGVMVFYGWSAEAYGLTVTATGDGLVNSTPAGINNCRAAVCSAGFGSGASVTLTATPDSGMYFGHWKDGTGPAGDCNNSPDPTCSFTTSTQASTITGTFNQNPELTVIVKGGVPGVSSVNDSGGYMPCSSGETCSTTRYTSASNLILSVVYGEIESWQGCPNVPPTNPNICTIQSMGSLSRTITATFAAPETNPPGVSITDPDNNSKVKDSITVLATASDDVGVVGVQFKLDGNNLGDEVTTSPYSISWDTKTASNGSHTLTAVARDAAGNSATSAGVNVTVSNTAAFDFSLSSSPASATVAQGDSSQTTVTVTKIAGAAAAVSLSYSGLPSGATASLSTASCTPSPNCTSLLTLNSGSASIGTYSITITGISGSTSHTTSYSWTIQPIVSYTLTVNKSPGIAGRVTASDLSINCGSACSAQYNSGTQVTLTAVGDTFYSFSSWTGCDSTSDNQCTVTMSSNKTVTANFVRGGGGG